MAKFNDGYYDPPEENLQCSICHYGEDNCTCPECDQCGEAGNPSCINTHMPWERWGHFQFRLSEAEQKAEREREIMENIIEQDMWRDIEEEGYAIRLPEDEEFLNRIGQLDDFERKGEADGQKPEPSDET
jgi:hypothetical protein